MEIMKLGHLNLPKPEIERFSFVHDIQTRLYLQYSSLIESTEIGKQVLSALEADPRVRGLDGKMISKGSSASGFEPRVLAMWFLWAVNEFGREIAEKNLDTFLNSHEIPIINALWVLGIETDESIQLENGLVITPISEMPDSREKENYLRINIDASGHQQPKPKAAITFKTKITKSYKSDEDLSVTLSRDKGFWEASKLLYDASLAINVIESISCVPYFSTAYTLPQMPIGLFGGSGGGIPQYDVIGRSVSKITPEKKDEINAVISSFLALRDKEKVRFSRVLSRLSQSKRRDQIEDKILDLGIALEMALLDDNKNHQQLSLAFRLRGSWLIASDDNERLSIYQQLKDIYNYRSQVAHSGVLCGNDPAKINVVRESYANHSMVAERIIRKLICEGRPDWQKLLLGVAEK